VTAFRTSLLIIQPDVQVGRAMAKVARTWGLGVDVARDGEQGLDLFAELPTDIVVVDASLPGRSAIATVTAIRQAPGGRVAKVILTNTSRLAPEVVDEIAQRIQPARTASPENVASLIAELAGVGKPRGSSTSRETVVLAQEDDETIENDRGAERESREVRWRSTQVTESKKELEGTFEQHALGRVLHRIAEMRAQGALVVTASGVTVPTAGGDPPRRIVFFRNGVALTVQSNLRSERLGEVLLAMGLLERTQLDRALVEAERSESRLGSFLLGSGDLAPGQLREALERQLQDRLFGLFDWDDATFRFSGSAPLPNEAALLEMSLPEIVYRGCARHTPTRALEAMLTAHGHRYVVPVPSRISPFALLGLPNEARRVLLSIDGRVTLRALTERRDEQCSRLLHALECIEAVSFREAAEPVEWLTSPDDDDSPDTDVSNLNVLREELNNLCRLLRNGELHAALGATASDAEAFSVAAGRALARFEAVSKAVDHPPEIRGLAVEVLARIKRAVREATPGASTASPDEAPNREEPADTDPERVPSTLAADRHDSEQVEARIARLLRAEQLVRTAESALARKKYDEAIASLEHAVGACPSEGEFLALLALARYAAAEGKGAGAERAVDDLKHACTLDPSRETPWLLYGRVLYDRGDRAAAMDAYERALTCNPLGREALSVIREGKAPPRVW